MRRSLVVVMAVVCSAAIHAQNNRIDTVSPSAPELAAHGPLAVGVRTTRVTDTNRPDILNTKEGAPTPRYDRTLTLEVWYPAMLAPGQKPGGEYKVITRDPATIATLYGRAVRDASPRLRQGFGEAGSGRLETGVAAPGGYPLVIISHGYPGNRFLMSHRGENLASRGFVVVSIDHKDSTYDDQQAFGSTLYNRPFDQLFVLNAIERLNRLGSSSFLTAMVDTSRTQGAVNADRYLLTFINANHNAAAPYPGGRCCSCARCPTPHFATAYFGIYLKGESDKQAYLDVVPNGKDAVYAMDRDRRPAATHTYWKGFRRGTAVGLVLEHAKL